MRKTQGRATQKSGTKIKKKSAPHSRKKILSAKRKKSTTQNLLKKAKNKLEAIKKTSSKNLHHAKDKLYATEEILEYVKENPIKSISAVALTTLIAGFISSRYKK